MGHEGLELPAGDFVSLPRSRESCSLKAGSSSQCRRVRSETPESREAWVMEGERATTGRTDCRRGVRVENRFSGQIRTDREFGGLRTGMGSDGRAWREMRCQRSWSLGISCLSGCLDSVLHSSMFIGWTAIIVHLLSVLGKRAGEGGRAIASYQFGRRSPIILARSRIHAALPR